MTVARFYERASTLPFVVTGGALVVGLATGYYPHVHTSSVVQQVNGMAAFFVIFGWCAIIPYSIFIAIASKVFKPARESAYRRLAWATPPIIALPFGLVIGVWTGQWQALAFFGIAALCFGYLYVIPIEVAFLIGRALGWIVPETNA